MIDRLTFFVGFAALLASIIADYVAIVALQHADQSGKETTAALNAANASLRAVVSTLNASRSALDNANASLSSANDALLAMKSSAAAEAKAEGAATQTLANELGLAAQQVIILRSTLDTASKQYRLSSRQYESEVARENAQPDITMSIKGILPVRELSSGEFLVRKSPGGILLELVFRNVGTAPLISATVNVSSEPKSVNVEQVQFLSPNGYSWDGQPSVFTSISPFGKRDSHPPDSVTDLVVVPFESQRFTLSVSVAGIGGAFTKTFRFVVAPTK